SRNPLVSRTHQRSRGKNFYEPSGSASFHHLILRIKCKISSPSNRSGEVRIENRWLTTQLGSNSCYLMEDPSIRTKVAQRDHYLNGLRPHLYKSLCTIAWKDRWEGYHAAMNLERADQRILEQKVASKESGKGKVVGSREESPRTSRSKKKKARTSNQGCSYPPPRPIRSAPSPGTPPNYNFCGRPHLGECKIRTSTCFGCGEQGHYKRECPNRVVQGRATSEPTVNDGRAPSGIRFGSRRDRGHNNEGGHDR
ncbi:hypothetical protein LINPERHAP1_LOCUS7660, partial [Linum perenne]